MSPPPPLSSAFAGLALVLVLIASLAGCVPVATPDGSRSASASPSPTPDGSQSASDTASPSTDGTNSASDSPPPSADGPRFLIECYGPDGPVIGPFTGLDEAWASTNYVRIDHCVASGGTDQPVELTAEEESIAGTAAEDLPDDDLVDLYLWTLATCVRVAPTSAEGLSTLPSSLLRATLELCPEAPHAGLVEDELEARSQ